jgi:uncharacterized protein with GYD domain
MTRYLTLLTFTDQGIRNVKQTVQRAKEFRASVETAGGKVLAQYWAVGGADGCLIFEAPDEATGAGLLLALGQQGNVRTQTMRLLDDREIKKIIPKG